MQVSRRDAIRLFGSATVGVLDPFDRGTPLEPGLCASTAVAGFEAYCFVDSKGTRHQTYVVGRSGPPVLLLHELPGLVTDDLDAARRIADFGYTVIAPLFFGKPGRKASARATALNSLRVCDDREFACNSSRKTSPHVQWLRELVPELTKRWSEGRGLTVIGMCLTGAFPIALLQKDVVAAVVCQPTVPINLFSRFGWFTDESGLGLDDEDLARAKNDSRAPILGIRYTGDWRCRPQRFERLTSEFGDRFCRIDLEGKAHSTLASACRPEALEEVKAFLNRYARREPDAQVPTFPHRSRCNSREPVLVKLSAAACPAHGKGTM
jgi:dienelactone hydrolase